MDQISPATSYKLLGVQIASNGNSMGQTEALKNKCMKFQETFSQLQLDCNDIDLGYKCVATPSLNYGLAASNIGKETLQNIQKQLHNTILPKLGYNRHFPRSICYASPEYGGLGISNLYVEQSIAHINSLLGNIRAKNALGNLIIILLESYIMQSGIVGSPLINLTQHSYVDSPWIDTIRNFLSENNSTIYIKELNTLSTIREKDQSIMELAINHNLSPSNIKQINNCRLYLQITSLAEMCNSEGTQLLPCAIHGHRDDNNNAILWQISTSTLKWPQQSYPPIKCWKIWKKFMQQLTKPGTCYILKKPLGHWKHNTHQYRN